MGVKAMDDDAELLRRYCEGGSEAAFRQLVERHVNLVFGAALRRTGGDPHRAREIVQTVFITLEMRAAKLVGHPSLAGWLFTATRNAAINAGIAEKRRQARETAAGSLAVVNTDPSDSVDWGQLRLVLDEAMDDLRQGDREIVLLHYYKGETLSDVSRRLGIRENAVRMRIGRALEKLQRSLRKRGVISTSAGLATALSAHGSMVAPEGLAAAAATTALGVAAQSAVGAGLLGGLTFMTSTKVILTGAALVVVGLLTYDMMALRTEAQQMTLSDGKSGESAQLANRSRVLGRQLENLDRQMGLIESARAEAKSASAAAPTPAPNAFVSPTRPYLSDPTYRALYRVAQQARYHMQFQDLYRELGLQPADIEKFEALMVEQSMANQDGQIARDLGQDEQAIYRRSGPIWSAGMSELLGPDGKKRLEVYLRSTAVRAFINSLATLTYPLNEQITPDQAARIHEIALENDATYQSGKGTDPSKVNWTAVLPSAAAVLSPEQLAAFQTMVESRMLKYQIQQSLSASP